MALHEVTWIYGAGMIARGLLLAALLVVCWIGWLRQKHPGYAVLIGWALSTMLFLGLGSALPLILSRVMAMGANASNHPLLMALFNTFGSILNSSLLLLGLAMLVFRKSSPDQTTSSTLQS